LQYNEINIEGTVALLSHATDYYKELLGNAPINLYAISPDLWGDHEKLILEDNLFDKALYSRGGENILFLMKLDKAPHPDSIPIAEILLCMMICICLMLSMLVMYIFRD
jgi:hypothetical protein